MIGLDQIVIAICGPTAVWLSLAKAERVRRWGPVVGICAQPAWFYSAYQAQQVGISVVTVVYTFVWLAGVWGYWGPKRP